MFKTFMNAMQVKEIRKKIMYTLLMLVVVRFGSMLPVPGTNASVVASIMNTTDGIFGFFNSITGGSFESFSIFALSITPYITASIIIQLLTIAIPKLEELQKDGEEGRKKLAEYTRYATVVLALIESIGMAIGFGSQGLLTHYTWYNVVVVVIALTAGSAVLMWIGERITENGVGNGISIVLLINILSRIPSDTAVLYERFMKGQSAAMMCVAAIVIAAVIFVIVGFVVLLNNGTRRIPVQYAQKVQGRRSFGGLSTHIPLKVNTAGVIPVIFASSLMSFPVVIAQFFNVDFNSVGGHILMALNSSNWCRTQMPWYSLGMILYVVLIIGFAYYYTYITFNPLEIANNMKKQGGFIPGIRPGKPTSEYLQKILRYIIFIGAVGLTVVCLVPIMFSGFMNMSSLSFTGTSMIIVVGVVLETMKAIESQMMVRNYKGFLND